MQLLDWIGRSETAEDRAAAGPFAALAATLDISGAAAGEHPAPGTPLPPQVCTSCLLASCLS